jgi:hypothetical protein
MSKNRLSKKAQALQRSILSNDDVRELTDGLRDAMGHSMTELFLRYGIDPEQHFRFMAVARRIVERREAKGLDIKTVARQMKVPQYRVRDIENGRVNRIVPALLAGYVNHLELKVWFGRWKKKNPSVVTKIGL